MAVAVLYVGTLIEVLDISMAVIASFACVVAVIEYGGAAPWFIWGATSLISLIILPQKLPAVMFFVFFGFYPILKEKLERIRSRVLLWAIKIGIFNVAIFAVVAAAKWFLLLTDTYFAFELLVFVLANAVLILYDVAMTRAISFYIFRLRRRLRIDKMK